MSRTVHVFPVFCLLLCQAAASSIGQTQSQSDPPSRPRHQNALARETSPYLLMHAHNPVNWYGWGEEALERAKTENKPIFLSVGYSSCHWCHVMERESFLDEEIANFLNENFICIKVDREERPDVDAIYMESLRVVNRRTSGGWPLSMFLTPDAKPFFGGTYFPARDGDRGANVGFLTVVQRVHDAWINKTDRIRQDAEFVSEQVKKRLAGFAVAANAKVDATWPADCLAGLETTFDQEFGGFGRTAQVDNAPKFPEPSNLLFLADQLQREDPSDVASPLFVTTCERMMMGGLWDHLGGGFHRYSVDRFWRIPHFEKMLYDNAQLASVYSQAFQITQRPDFRMVVEEMLEFVIREFQDEGGAFYASLDAESDGEEGKFYRWSKEAIESLLTDDEFQLFAEVYGLNGPPNFEQQYYVPQLTRTLGEAARARNEDVSALIEKLRPIRKKLFNARADRPRPLTDKKILASWNGMMIRGLADAGRILNNEYYLTVAGQAADFVLQKMVDNEGRLVRTYTAGQPRLNAYLPDYACLIDGLLALHRATGEPKWLKQAAQLQAVQDRLFWDETGGGYFYTSNDHESLLARAKRTADGAVPSGNSVAAGNLVYLAAQYDDDQYLSKARRTTLAGAPLLDQIPVAAPRLLITLPALVPGQDFE